MKNTTRTTFNSALLKLLFSSLFLVSSVAYVNAQCSQVDGTITYTGLPATDVLVDVYADLDGNGIVDATDIRVGLASTDGSGNYTTPSTLNILDNLNGDVFSGFNNSIGLANWNQSSWTRNSTTNVVIVNNGPFPTRAVRLDYQLSYMERAANLSSFSSADLLYQYDGTASLDPGDLLVVQYSTDGGTTFLTLNTHNNDPGSAQSISIAMPAAALTANTIIRFQNLSNTNDEFFYVDNVEIVGVLTNLIIQPQPEESFPSFSPTNIAVTTGCSGNDFSATALDTDMDMVLNGEDLDDDNDGILDATECDFVFLQQPDNTNGTAVINVGYNQERYGINGSNMSNSDNKLLNPDNFGPLGIYNVTFNLVPIATANVSRATLEANNIHIFHVGLASSDAGSGTSFTTLTASQKADLYSWSTAAPDRIVLGFQGLPSSWGAYGGSNGVTNPMTTTVIGESFLDGVFGTASGFNQGGSYKGKYNTLPAAENYFTLIEDGIGRVVAFVDNASQDIFFADVDILSSLGGMTNNDGISSANDILFANLYAFMAQTILQGQTDMYSYLATCTTDTDGDGIVNSLDLDSDGDGCPDAMEGAGIFDATDVAASGMPGGNSGVDYLGTAPLPVDLNLTGATPTNVGATGIPTVANQTNGQGVGLALSTASIPDVCECDTAFQQLNSDSDDVTDACDLDDDNDGILDSEECDFEFLDDPAGNGSTVVINVGYNVENYGITGLNMPFNDDKLLNVANFGSTGTYNVTFNLVAIPTADVNRAVLEANDIHIFQAGLNAVDAGSGSVVTVFSPAQLASIYSWSTASIDHIVLGFQGMAAYWGDYGGTSGVTNPMTPTEAGETFFDGIFGSSAGLNQGGSYRGKYGDLPLDDLYCTLIEDANGQTVAFIDKATQDIFFADVDIFSRLGGVTENNGVSSTNDILYTNLYAFMAQTILQEKSDMCGYLLECNADTDNDGIPNSLDLDSDGDGCPDAVEGAGGYTFTDLSTNAGMAGGSTNVQQNLGTSSNTDGTPNLVGDTTDSESQGVGVSQTFGTDTECCNDAANYAFVTDTDGDNIGNACDLDDDNDGILDTDECVSELVSPFVDWTNNDWQIDSGNNSALTQLTAAGAQSISNTFDNLSGLALLEFTIKVKSFNPSNSSTSMSIANLSFEVDNVEYVLWQNTMATAPSNPVPGNLTTFSGAVISPSTFNVVADSDPYTEYTITIPWDATDDEAIISFSYQTDESDFRIKDFTLINATALNSCDTDNDSIPNYLDLDTDGDGCPDALEAAVPSALTTGNIVNGSIGSTTSTSTANAVINTTSDPVGTNGYANSLESADISAATASYAFVATNYATYALDNAINGCGTPMITQVYWKGDERIVEVTNNDASKIIVPNAANINFFDEGVTTARTATTVNTTAIAAGGSLLFSSEAVTAQHTGTPIINTGVTAFDNANDIITISRSGKSGTSNLPWDSRIDVVSGLTDNTAFVRIDETLVPNKTYTAAEWVAFVDDNLDVYTNPPERHPHTPLLSEIINSNTEANMLLGLHRFGVTKRIAAPVGTEWDNGYPDRSRHVVIEVDYHHNTARLSARKLVVNNSSKLAVTDNLLVVTNDITLTGTNDEVRLVGTSQLVQTHTSTSQVTGLGKLLIDQTSTVPSIYRYNYLSSPVNTIGASAYRVMDVLKDGTTPTDVTSAIGTIAKDITFVSGYDGSIADPIKLADYWIYTYASADGLRSSWLQKRKDGVIPQTDGFIIKGPGRAQNYTFMGTPKDGNLTTIVGQDESYLVGNPFSSALSVKKFIEDNLATTTATLYFWQHAGEEDTSTDTSGHNYRGYIGGYATRNISAGVKADAPQNTDYNIIVEAESASFNTTSTTHAEASSVVMNSTSDTLTFERIPKGMDTLRIRYSAATIKNLKVNDLNFILPASPIYSDYALFEAIMCVDSGSDITISSTDTNTIYIDYIQIKDGDGQLSCAPGTGSGFAYDEPAPYVAIGQGFFIQGDASGGGEVVFNNSQREFIKESAATSVFFKSGKEKTKSTNKKSEDSGFRIPLIKLGMDYLPNEGVSRHRQIAVSFSKDNSFAYNKGYDSEIFDKKATDIYWKFPEDDLNYVIAGVEAVSEGLEVPLELVIAHNGMVSLKLDKKDEINKDIYLKDKLINRTYLLDTEESIALQLSAGTYTNRFSLAFKGNILATEKDLKLAESNLAIYIDRNSNEVVILNKNNLTINKVELFNILGQKIKQWIDLDQALENRLSVKKISNQIYIVKVQTDKGNMNKKIIIE